MSIWIDKTSRVIVQGITGHAGMMHSASCLAYGTQIVGGVTPGKSGETVHGNVPVFNTVAEACVAVRPNVSFIAVPAPHATDAILEAIDAEIPLVVCLTEGIPVHDTLRIYRALSGSKTRLIGSNCPGLIAPGKCKVGIIPNEICKEGSVGIVSRSGTLLFEAIYQLTAMGYGQSTCIGIGGDPVVGTSFIDVLKAFDDDPQTKAIVLIGEIGGNAEETAADFIRQHMRKPVVGYIAGRCTPEGKRMGHAGAMIAGNTGTALSKINALQTAGVEIAQNVTDIGRIVAKVLG